MNGERSPVSRGHIIAALLGLTPQQRIVLALRKADPITPPSRQFDVAGGAEPARAVGVNPNS